MADLTPDEIAFFATGELPATLAAEVAEPAVAAPAPAPATAEPAVPPATPDAVADLRSQLAAERSRMAALEANYQRLAEQGRTPAPALAPQEPNIADDPLGAMFHKLNKVTDTVTKLEGSLTQQQQVAQQQQQFVDFQRQLQTLRDDFTKTTPDFQAAYAHLRTTRMDDLRDIGIPESRIAEALLHDEIAASQNAIAQGKNPAQVIYNMAKRAGYTAKAVPQDAAAKLAAIAAGTAADVAPGKADSTQQLTFSGLKDASESDLNKLVQDPTQWAKLVGNTNNSIF